MKKEEGITAREISVGRGIRVQIRGGGRGRDNIKDI